jgi:hypothetical protein
MLMHADNRGVDHLDGSIMGSGECVYDTTPHARSPPAAMLPKNPGIQKLTPPSSARAI